MSSGPLPAVTPVQKDSRLADEVSGFVAQLQDTIELTLKGIQGPLKTEVSPTGKLTVTTKNKAGIPLTVDDSEVLTLKLHYHCAWDSTKQFLAVDASSFAVTLPGVTEPLLHFDYVRKPQSRIPGAHINVHGHRDELVYAMLVAGKKFRGKNRVKGVLDGKVPRLADLHFPVGGSRFRPCLEDILQMLIYEFGIDTETGWQDVLEDGRRVWKDNQLGAAVRDNPTKAVQQLEIMGFKIDPPDCWPDMKTAKLNEY